MAMDNATWRAPRSDASVAPYINMMPKLALTRTIKPTRRESPIRLRDFKK
jgi:hypothetical protein